MIIRDYGGPGGQTVISQTLNCLFQWLFLSLKWAFVGKSHEKCWFFWFILKLSNRFSLLSVSFVLFFLDSDPAWNQKPAVVAAFVLTVSSACGWSSSAHPHAARFWRRRVQKQTFIRIYLPNVLSGSETLQVEPLKEQIRSFRRAKILKIPALSHLINRKWGVWRHN